MDKPTTTLESISIAALRVRAKERPSGYLDACFAAGKIDGERLLITRDAYARLVRQYRGWGDRVHDFLQPSVRRFDRMFGTHLATCSGCARRRRKLNNLGARFRAWLKQ